MRASKCPCGQCRDPRAQWQCYQRKIDRLGRIGDALALATLVLMCFAVAARIIAAFSGAQ